MEEKGFKTLKQGVIVVNFIFFNVDAMRQISLDVCHY